MAPKQETAIGAESHRAAAGEKSAAGRCVRDGFVFRDLTQRQGIHVSHVHGDVNDADHEHAQHHRQRHIAARFFNFACDPGDVDPSVIGPEHRDQSDAEGGNELSRAQSHGQLCPGAAAKWCQSPLPIANPRTTKAAMAANFAQVARFCSIVPQRSPTTLIQVSTATMEISATTWARVSTMPAAESAPRAPAK